MSGPKTQAGAPGGGAGRRAHPGALLALAAVGVVVRLAEHGLQLLTWHHLFPYQHPVVILPHLLT